MSRVQAAYFALVETGQTSKFDAQSAQTAEQDIKRIVVAHNHFNPFIVHLHIIVRNIDKTPLSPITPPQ